MAAEAVNNRSTRGIVAYLGPAFGMAWALWEVPIRLGLSPGNPLFLLAALPLRPWQPSSSAGGPMTLLLFAGVPAWLLVAMSASFAWVPLGLLCAWIVFTGRLAARQEGMRVAPLRWRKNESIAQGGLRWKTCG